MIASFFWCFWVARGPAKALTRPDKERLLLAHASAGGRAPTGVPAAAEATETKEVPRAASRTSRVFNALAYESFRDDPVLPIGQRAS